MSYIELILLLYCVCVVVQWVDCTCSHLIDSAMCSIVQVYTHIGTHSACKYFIKFYTLLQCFLPLKGCQGMVSGSAGGWASGRAAAGKSLSVLYLRNCKV